MNVKPQKVDSPQTAQLREVFRSATQANYAYLQARRDRDEQQLALAKVVCESGRYHLVRVNMGMLARELREYR